MIVRRGLIRDEARLDGNIDGVSFGTAHAPIVGHERRYGKSLLPRDDLREIHERLRRKLFGTRTRIDAGIDEIRGGRKF